MVTGYYLRPDGRCEKVRLHRIDFDAAKRRTPDLWDSQPFGGEIIDRTREWGDPAYRTSCIPPPSRQLTGIDDKVGG
jgi:hypothetical protein